MYIRILAHPVRRRKTGRWRRIAHSLANTINGLRILQNTGATSQQVKTVVEMALAAIRA